MNRKAIVEEALSWTGTPFHPEGRVKGPHGGCDCATFIQEVFIAAGVIQREALEYYPMDGFAHTEDPAIKNRYLHELLKHCRELVLVPMLISPGNIVLFRLHGSYWHGGIITDWPKIIHAAADANPPRVVVSEAGKNPSLPIFKARFFEVTN